MPLKSLGVIRIPGATGSAFDHAAFDPKTRRVFIAHTARDVVEVIDHDAGIHEATLPGFRGVAGAVADDGEILVTNRGSASIAWLDAATLETKAVLKTGARPNGAAIVKHLSLGIVACIGDDRKTPTLHAPTPCRTAAAGSAHQARVTSGSFDQNRRRHIDAVVLAEGDA